MKRMPLRAPSAAQKYDATFRKLGGLDEAGRARADKLAFASMEETVFVRDRRIYKEKLTSLRKQYKQEYSNDLEDRFFAFQKEVDHRAARDQAARELAQERRRLRKIRLRELDAATAATKARKKMERSREQAYMQFDMRDQRRDVIRGMLHESPTESWITRDNIAERLNESLLDESSALPGLPKVGEYDTLQGLYSTSDVYFGERRMTDNEAAASITGQAIHNYKRKSDSSDEWLKEHMPYLTGMRKKRKDFKKEQGKLMPTWWYKVDWGPIEEREQWLDDPVIFNDPKSLLEEVDSFDDGRLLYSPAYWELMKREAGDREKVEQALERAYADVERADESDLPDLLHQPMEPGPRSGLEREIRHRRWGAYDTFYDYMYHRRKLDWSNGKMNLDSQMRTLRRDLPKWKHMAFSSDEEYDHWKQTQAVAGGDASTEISEEAEGLLATLKDSHYTGRKTGLPAIEASLRAVSPDALKSFYLLAEELCDRAERMGC